MSFPTVTTSNSGSAAAALQSACAAAGLDVSHLDGLGQLQVAVANLLAAINSTGTVPSVASLTISGDAGLVFTNGVDAAGANTGTLTNCPHTGNPAHWGKVSWDGTVYAIALFALS